MWSTSCDDVRLAPLDERGSPVRARCGGGAATSILLGPRCNRRSRRGYPSKAHGSGRQA
jgi:hypothetical protein